MGRLVFKMADVRRVVEHALTSKQHMDRVSYDAEFNRTTEPGEPGVLLVHDDGVYLMSNGLPRDILERLGPAHDGDGRSFAAYAEGCDPRQDVHCWDTARDLVGGDDFSEILPWIEPICDAMVKGATHVIVGVAENNLTLAFEKRKVTQ